MKNLISRQDDGIGTLLSRAVAEAQDVARAEIALQKARLSVKVAEGRSAAIFLVGALVTGGMTLTALVVGSLLVLQRLLGPGWATLIVAGTLLAATGLLAWLGLRDIKAMVSGPGAKS